jgi:RimJ/RimL family protein N-acetyltransferase
MRAESPRQLELDVAELEKGLDTVIPNCIREKGLHMYLETQRLIIRSWKDSDLQPYAQLVADPDVMKFIGDGTTQTSEQARHFIQTMMAREQDRGWILWAVEHKFTAELMGFCGFGVLDEQLDFGWRYAKKFWGQGFGTEAAHAVLRYGIETYGLQQIRSVAYTENRASIRIMEKVGMHLAGFGSRHNRDVAYYYWRAESR